MTAYPLAACVTVLSLFVYFWMATQIGKARREHGIAAPEMQGPEAFNRVIRVHGNTIEMMILFLPSLWLFALIISDFWAGIIGVFFPIGRIIYARGYYQASDKRGRGFMIGFIPTLILLIGATLGSFHAAYATYM
jgi:glutathione S-transferase